MDDPLLGRDKIETVLRDINRVNTLLGGNRITLRALKRLVERYPREEYSILDVGCGDGTMLREVAIYCRKRKVNVRLTGIDINENSIQIARERNSDIPNTVFIKEDLFELDSQTHQCDILLCSLTLHHFEKKDIMAFLRKFERLAGIGVIINDLDRNRIGYILFKLYSSLFMRTGIAKKDGLVSIKSGFTKRELISYSKMLPNVKHKICWRWAFRFEWTFWHPNKELQ